jgi:hypothetical protein
MKFSDVTVDAVVDSSTATDRKTPIFNISFAASNSNAKRSPEIKFLLTLFEFLFGNRDDGDDDNSRDNDLKLYFKR